MVGGNRMKVSRKPAVAGSFYPDDPQRLASMVDELLAQNPMQGYRPKALIVPHAGYIYSGAIAACAYNTLHALRNTLRRVILLGPSHYVAFHGLACSEADTFVTPLGAVKLNKTDLSLIQSLPQVKQLAQAHQREHSLEVQLPFLQRTLPSFTLLPLVVGDASAEEVSEVLERLWGGDETLIVVSSDLSHYLSYSEAKVLDLATSRAIETLNTEGVGADQACGRAPLIGLLNAAKAHRLHATTLDLRNSGDTAGTKDRVVGYGAYVLQ